MLISIFPTSALADLWSPLPWQATHGQEAWLREPAHHSLIYPLTHPPVHSCVLPFILHSINIYWAPTLPGTVPSTGDATVTQGHEVPAFMKLPS